MILLNNISKNFGDTNIFKEFSMEVKDKSFAVITGKSGSGKTTLLNMIGLLEKPTSGEISINGISKFNKMVIQNLRRNYFGYIFQNYALLENESVESNLLFSAKYNKEVTKSKIKDILKKVEIPESYLSKKIYLLSGGEQQRIAIARVMLKPCDLILADEPTGNLDKENTNLVLKLLMELRDQGKTIICVTHDQNIAEKADLNLMI